MPKKQPETNKLSQQHLLPFPIRLTKTQIERLDEIAKNEQSSRAEIAREAIQFYLDNYEINQQDKRQTRLERRIEQMDKHLASLLVKSIRVGAQNLYFSLLPYTKGGLPRQPLPQANINKYFAISDRFAVDYLKSKGSRRINAFEFDGQNEGQASEPSQDP